MSSFESAKWCIIYAAGIISMLLVYGVIQERIMSESYDGEMFKTSVFLVFCNRAVAIAYAAGMIKAKQEDFANKAPLWKYVAISISNVAATWCQYEALKYVSFPVQMLGKSFKMMPVMIWGILISQKHYGVKDWSIAAGVTWGVVQFLLTGETKSKHAAQGTSIYGLGLLLAFLACDGFTSTFQEKLFKEHKTSKYNQMLYVNGGSAVVSIFTLVASGGIFTALGFCARHPELLVHSSSLSAAAVAGQFFIYSLVKEYGALALAATMNVRQVLSILVSYSVYAKPVSFLQTMGLAIVFGTLFYKTYDGYLSSKAKEMNAKTSAAACPQEIGAANAMKSDASELEAFKDSPAEARGLSSPCGREDSRDFGDIRAFGAKIDGRV